MCRLGQGIGKSLGFATTFGTWVYFCTGWFSGVLEWSCVLVFEILAKVRKVNFSKMCRLGQGLGKTLGCATTFGTWVYFCTVWLSGVLEWSCALVFEILTKVRKKSFSQKSVEWARV